MQKYLDEALAAGLISPFYSTLLVLEFYLLGIRMGDCIHALTSRASMASWSRTVTCCILSTVECVQGIFTKLDLGNDYYLVQIPEEDEWKITFNTW